jgi:hypothetical protein
MNPAYGTFGAVSVLTAKGKIIRQGEDKERPSRTVIYVPVDVARDSSFPFSEDTQVRVTIEPGKRQLIVSEV